jgi:hypothetical protein
MGSFSVAAETMAISREAWSAERSCLLSPSARAKRRTVVG